MKRFNVKFREGKLVPLGYSQQRVLNKILDYYERSGETFTITIEKVTKPINNDQAGLYRAFIVKACDYFGNTYSEMESLLDTYKPKVEEHGKIVNKDVSLWTTKELNNFIDQASAQLAEFGFKF